MMRLDISHVVNYFHCDLQCPYCVTDWTNQRGTRDSRPEDVSEMRERRVLSAIAGLPYRVHLTLSNAGEPLVNPWLLDLVADVCLPPTGEGLTALTLVTNLHGDWDRVIAPFLDRVDTTRLALCCSLHDSVISTDAAEAFFDSCTRARDRGVFVMVVSVVLPGQLDRAFACRARCDSLGIPYMPNPLVAAEGGRGFDATSSPYSPEDIARVRELAETPHAHKVLFERRTTRGVACQAGSRYVYVDSSGDAFPCVSLKRGTEGLGNVIDGSFDPRPGPMACPLTSCGCATDASAMCLVEDRYTRTVDHRYLQQRHDVEDSVLQAGYGPSLWSVSDAIGRLRRRAASSVPSA
jgi:pyruvate-formate lyase-activating enzyme